MKISKTKVISYDGLPLTVFQTPLDKPKTLLFVNAFGIKAAASFDLASSLYRHGINFLTWDTRGLPGEHGDNFREYTVLTHVKDLFSIIEHFQLDKTHLLGWCAGAEIALFASRENDSRLLNIILVNGAFSFSETIEPSGFAGKAALTMVKRIVSQESYAGFYYKVYTSYKDYGEMMGLSNNKKLAEIVSSAFRESPEGLIRYAYLIRNQLDNNIDGWIDEVKKQSYVLFSLDDQLANNRNSQLIAQKLNTKNVRIFNEGGHYNLFFHQPVINEIIAIINGNERFE